MATRKSVADDLHDESSAAYQRGMAEMHRQLGPMSDAYIERIKRLSPEFAWVNVTFPFGELYTRDVVDMKTRELCTVAALTVQGFSIPELKIHIDAALRSGASRAEIVEIITQMIAYCGFPAATNALLTAEAVFAVHDAPKTKPKPARRTGAKA
ncbi:carboxymuconolactone decarboxylase family protein [Enterovirga sp.]|jgi:4-carboxymuconolactone decarboxylase|uniref:carboxymuconolactone decarboxylase family protein n=1 Tax=Enterovirga sp. TaxID=2026350 RepID=UPI00262AEDFD|nr:carboxymuconolactone decarboxylase family protein [Enterovirga sp.]MDB5591048.1 carboxymuconolactone decarboxylase family protein [Enterovirga sp.]